MGDLSALELIYWAAAVIGGTLFVLRLVLMFTGVGAGDGDLEAAGDGQADFAFNLLSLQGLTAFFTMFGLIGLTLLNAGVHAALTMVGGTAAGLLTVFILSLLFTQAGRLQSEGTLDIRNAVGENGTVYLRVPPGGSGQVQVPVQGAMRTLDAVTTDPGGLSTGTKVRITGVQDRTTVIVEKLQ